METLMLFDQWLISKFESFVHLFQRWTSRTNYFLALVTLCIGDAGFAWYALEKKKLFFFAILGLVSLPDVGILSVREKESIHRLESGIANPLKRSAFPIRMLAFCYSLFFWFFNFTEIILNSALLFCLLSFYFQACDPLPPAKSKIREWIESFSLKPATASSRA